MSSIQLLRRSNNNLTAYGNKNDSDDYQDEMGAVFYSMADLSSLSPTYNRSAPLIGFPWRSLVEGDEQDSNICGMLPCMCYLIFLVCHKRNSLPLGLIQPSSATKEFHGCSRHQTDIRHIILQAFIDKIELH